MLLGRAVNFTPASEPTNIIWENRHIKGANLYVRGAIAVLLIGIMLAFAFSFILFAKKYAINNAAVFAKLDCKNFETGLRVAGWDDAKLDEEF